MQSSAAEPLANVIAPTWCDKLLLRELEHKWRVAYLYFGISLCLILGSQNMIQPPTTSAFIDSVSYEEIPLAQSYLPLVYLPILFFYNFLYATFKGNPVILVAILCGIYAVLYGIIGINSLSATGGRLEPLMGWILYYASNTKSVLFPVMFWSIMNDVSAATTANGTSFSRIAYGSLVFAGQAGGIIGSLISGNNEYLGGTSTLLILQAAVLVFIPITVWRGCRLSKYAQSSDIALLENDEPAVAATNEVAEVQQNAGGCNQGCRSVGQQLWGIVEGLYLILTHPVLLGIFWIAAAHLVPRVILDYQGTGVVNWRWPKGPHSHPNRANKEAQTAFFAYCNLANNLGTMALSFLGLRKIIEKGGLALGLIACPIVSITSVLIVCFVGDEQNMTRFWTVQVVLVFVNVVQYALNGPCREMLYVRCSKNIKYKAKSWADMYGNILQKTIAAQINLHVNDTSFHAVWTGIYCSAWTAVWIVISLVLGFYHTTLVKNNLQVGKDDVGLWPCLATRKGRYADGEEA